MPEPQAQHERFLRRLAMNDVGALTAVMCPSADDREPSALDAKRRALVRLAGLVALDCEAATYQWGVGAAFAAGSSADEVVDVLVAVAPVVGAVRAPLPSTSDGRSGTTSTRPRESTRAD
jgi:alkylhydroperoxidase/carboxymuconolactone decarboxylase family protein YurZ